MLEKRGGDCENKIGFKRGKKGQAGKKNSRNLLLNQTDSIKRKERAKVMFQGTRGGKGLLSGEGGEYGHRLMSSEGGKNSRGRSFREGGGFEGVRKEGKGRKAFEKELNFEGRNTKTF